MRDGLGGGSWRGRTASGFEPINGRVHRSRGRMVFYGIGGLAGMEKNDGIVDGRNDPMLYILRFCGRLGRLERGPGQGQKNPLSSISDSCGGAAAFMKKKGMEGSYTLEAAIVVSVVILSLWTMIHRAYQLHDQVTGNMILHEAVELSVHGEEPDFSERARSGSEALDGLFTFHGSDMELKQKGDTIEGRASCGEWSRQIIIKDYCPQGFLRKVTLLEELGEGNGSSI